METRREYNRIPLALPAVALIAGIVLFRLVPAPLPFAVALAVAMTAAAAAAAFRKTPRWSLPAILTSVFLGLGGLAAYMQTPADASRFADAERLEGTVGQCVMTASGYRLTVDVDKAIFPDGTASDVGNLRMMLLTDAETAGAGHTVRFPARFTDAADLPVFDADRYAKTLLTKGIRYSCRAEVDEVEALGPARGPTAAAARMRERVESLILASGLRPAAKAFATAIITADRSLITDDTVSRFSQAGIAHILALSGLHIGIITAIVAALLVPLNLLLHLKVRYFLIIAALWTFTLFTGFSGPTTRACVMATVFFTEMILERPHSNFNALCAAILIIAVANPAAVFDPGFQLSIACVGSILLLARRLNPVRQREHPVLHSAAGIVVASLIASIGSWIITGYYFRNLTLANLPANIIAIPLTAPFLGLSILHVILLAFGMEWNALGFILDNAYELLEKLAGTMASGTPFSPPGDAAILWTLAIIFLGMAIHWDRRGWMKYLPAVATAFTAAAIAFIAPEPREEGLIISRSNGTLQIAYRLPDEEGNIPFGRGITSFAQIGDRRCAIIQKPLSRLDDNQRTLLASSDVIILAGSFSGDTDSLLAALPRPDVSSTPLIITGPYLRRHVRAALLSELSARRIPHATLDPGTHIRLTNRP